MSPISSEINFAVQIITAALVFFVLHRSGFLPRTRKSVVRWSAALILAVTSPFWIAASLSFSSYEVELGLAVPTYQYAATLPAGAKFAHAFGGGMDAYALNQYAGAYISFERFLFTVLPEWMGLAVFHILAVGVSFFGAYRLSRAIGAERPAAFAAALFFTAASDSFYFDAIYNNMGTAVLPLAAYLLIYRQGRRFYWLGVFSFSAWYAVSSAVPYAIMNLLFVLPVIALIIDWRSVLRLFPALTAVLGFFILNMHEQIYAFSVVGEHTMRGLFGMRGGGGAAVPFMHFNLFSMTSVTAVGALAALAAAWAGGRRDGASARAALAVILYTPVLYLAEFLLPFIGFLKHLETLDWNYMHYGFRLTVMILAVSVMRLHFNHRGFIIKSCAALGFGKMGALAATTGLLWLSGGALSGFYLESLNNPAWRPAGLIRVVSIPFRLAVNRPPALGYESLDGYTHFSPAPAGPYWWAITAKDPDMQKNTIGPNFMRLFTDEFSKCCMEYDLAKIGVGLDLLRLANAGFIISRLPLTDPGVTKVAGPPDGTVLPRAGTPYLERIVPYVEWLIDPTEPYVYALADPFPRVYAPKGRAVAADGADYKTLIAAVREHALAGGLVVRESDSQTLGPAPGAAKVVSFEQVLNGYDVTLEPSGGTSNAAVILNVVYTPFWRAYADGVPVPLVQANQIQMAAAVPPGTRSLTFRYERPLLREKLFGK